MGGGMVGMGRAAAITAVVAVVALGAASTAAAQFGVRPYRYSTPLFTPKDGSNSTVVFASAEDASQVVNLRRYNAVGGLLSSTNVTLGAKSSIIAFAGANSGAQMHIEVWADSPTVMMEVTYTDAGNAVQKIPRADIAQVGPERGVPAAVVGVQRTADSIEATTNAVNGTVNTIQGTVFDVRTSVGALGPKLDAIAADVGAIRGQAPPAPDPRVAALQTQVTTLNRNVQTLRGEIRSLRRILLHRIPARRR